MTRPRDVTGCGDPRRPRAIREDRKLAEEVAGTAFDRLIAGRFDANGSRFDHEHAKTGLADLDQDLPGGASNSVATAATWVRPCSSRQAKIGTRSENREVVASHSRQRSSGGVGRSGA